MFKLGINFEVCLRFRKGGGHKLRVLAHIGEVEGEATALADRCVAREGEEVAGAAQFQILLGDLKAVIRAAHGLEPLLGGVAKLW